MIVDGVFAFQWVLESKQSQHRWVNASPSTTCSRALNSTTSGITNRRLLVGDLHFKGSRKHGVILLCFLFLPIHLSPPHCGPFQSLSRPLSPPCKISLQFSFFYCFDAFFHYFSASFFFLSSFATNVVIRDSHCYGHFALRLLPSLR